MVVAQIGVGQHIVADRLAGAQAPAVADHQPHMRTDHRQVVGDGLCVGRPHADVHHRDALSARRGQVIGWHLVLLPGVLAQRRIRVGRLARHHHAARARQLVIGTVGRLQLLAGPAHELVDVAVVVGEQHIGLHVLHRRSGVVPQPRQREVGPQPVEMRQGKVARRIKQAVGDLVADVRQVRGRKPPRQPRCHRPVQRHVQPVGHIGEGNFLAGQPDVEGRAILPLQQAQLLGEIGAEQFRPRDGGAVGSAMGQPGVGARLQRLGAVAVPQHSQLGIGEQTVGALGRIGASAGLHESAHGASQIAYGLVVEGFEAVQRRLSRHRLCVQFCHDLL